MAAPPFEVDDRGVAPVASPSRSTDPAAATRHRGPVIVVANSGSGAGRAFDALHQAIGVIFDSGREVTPLLAPFGRNLPDLAARAAELADEQRGVVVAAGGDGTIGTVATALLDLAEKRRRRPPPLGVLPLGTFNFFARSQQLPEDPTVAARAWLGGRTRPVPAGVVNGRAFLVHAALGLYARLLEDREAYKRQFGRHRAVAAWAGLMTLLRRSAPLSVTMALDDGRDERTIDTTTIYIGSNRLQLEQLGLPEAQAVAHGELAMLWLKPTTPWQRLRVALRGAFGDIASAEPVVTGSFRRLTVQPHRRRSRRPIKVAIDGEVTKLVPPLSFAPASWPLDLLVADDDAARDDAGARR